MTFLSLGYADITGCYMVLFSKACWLHSKDSPYDREQVRGIDFIYSASQIQTLR